MVEELGQDERGATVPAVEAIAPPEVPDASVSAGSLEEAPALLEIAETPEDEARFAAARRDYENGLGTMVAIGARYGITQGAIKWRIKRDLWTRRYNSKQVDRPLIISRLYRVLEMQVRDLELEMSAMAADNRRSGEREVAVLGRLAANLETLTKLDAKAERSARPERNREIKRVRDKLTVQIENLVRER